MHAGLMSRCCVEKMKEVMVLMMVAVTPSFLPSIIRSFPNQSHDATLASHVISGAPSLPVLCS